MTTALTLTTPESRSNVVLASDVNIVRITELIQIDYLTQTLTFRFEKGRVSGAIFIRESLSDNIVIDDQNFDTLLGLGVPDGAASLEANLHEVLLTYLIDQGLVGAGVIS